MAELDAHAWAERVQAAALQPVSPERRASRDSRDYTEDEVLAELRLMADDVRRAAASLGPMRAARHAELAAIVRDRTRHFRGPVALASALLGWLLMRADALQDADAAIQALDALEEGAETSLAHDLRAFIGAYLSGELDDEAFFRRISKPSMGVRNRRRPTTSAVHPSSIVLSEAARFFESRLGAAGSKPEAIWREMVQLVRTEMRADPPLELEDEVLVFAWGVEDGRFFVDVLRTFSLVDGNGDQEATKRLAFRYAMPLSLQNKNLDGEHWRRDSLDRWVAEVEALPVFAAFCAATDLDGPVVTLDQV